jgi:hypothetical protein
MKLPDNIVEFKLPKRKPKIREKEDVPYQKAYCITPFRAASDKRLHEGDYSHLHDDWFATQNPVFGIPAEIKSDATKLVNDLLRKAQEK